MLDQNMIQSTAFCLELCLEGIYEHRKHRKQE